MKNPIRALKERFTKDQARTDALMALNRTRPHGQIYAGTVSPHEKARRRAKNKVARRSRRINRGNR